MALRKIKLYGKLGQLFGREWNLDVNSVAEAIKAIDINTNNKFSQYLLKNGNKKYYKICVKNKKNQLSKEEIPTSFGSGDIYITPTVSGSGKYGQIIAGVALVAISYYTGGFGPNANFFSSISGKMGIALILGGVAQLLAPNANADSTDQRNSYLFQGSATTAYQGTSVGIVYGRALVPPMPVCISSDTLDINTYQGEIINLGAVGLLDESLFLYSYKQGTAILCGFSENTDYSVPPKKYLIRTLSGSARKSYDGSYFNIEIYGQAVFDINCTYLHHATLHVIGANSCNWPSDSFLPISAIPAAACFDSSVQQTRLTEYVNSAAHFTSSLFSELSQEYTEFDAILKLINSLSWSSWQTSPIYPYYYRNPIGFNIYYRSVKIKSITLPQKYNPSFSYKYSITLQRRIYNSTDPWQDAEIMETVVSPQSDGTLILPEVELNNISGYETKIKNATLNYN